MSGRIREDLSEMKKKLGEYIDKGRVAGYHEVSWDGRDSNGRKIASGVYIYVLKAGDFMDSKKMILIQ